VAGHYNFESSKNQVLGIFFNKEPFQCKEKFAKHNVCAIFPEIGPKGKRIVALSQSNGAHRAPLPLEVGQGLGMHLSTRRMTYNS
jgi:hypothetical protein